MAKTKHPHPPTHPHPPHLPRTPTLIYLPRCDLEENYDGPKCTEFWDFCDGNDEENWDLPQCTPPCELLDDPDSDPRCKDPEDDGSSDGSSR